jgi:hypothetical protein
MKINVIHYFFDLLYAYFSKKYNILVKIADKLKI